MSVTYEELLAANLAYDPHTGFVTHRTNYIAGENNRIIFGKQYTVAGRTIGKGRIAWMLYYQCTLEQWERVKFKDGNPYDTRIENMYLADLRRVRAVGAVHTRDSLGDGGANESRRQHCAARDLAGSNAEYLAGQLSLPGNMFAQPCPVPDEFTLTYLIAMSYGVCDQERITFAQEHGQWVLRFLDDRSAIYFRSADDGRIAISSAQRRTNAPASHSHIPAEQPAKTTRDYNPDLARPLTIDDIRKAASEKT